MCIIVTSKFLELIGKCQTPIQGQGKANQNGFLSVQRRDSKLRASNSSQQAYDPKTRASSLKVVSVVGSTPLG